VFRGGFALLGKGLTLFNPDSTFYFGEACGGFSGSCTRAFLLGESFLDCFKDLGDGNGMIVIWVQGDLTERSFLGSTMETEARKDDEGAAV
jgi:hypothetical protein